MMQPRRSTKSRIGNRRGATIVLVGLAITALLSVAALAVDIGMLLNARSEAQRAADSAALAGAGSIINYVGADTAGQATTVAIQFGETHDVAGQPVDLEPVDVEVDEAQGIVRVTVHRDQVRGGPVPTWFARVFGSDLVNVAAVAAARIDPTGSANCTKPFTIPDLYQDVNGNKKFDEGIDYYSPDSTGYGSPFRNTGHTGDNGANRINDFGWAIQVKGGGPNDGGCCPSTGPSWYYLWAYGGPGGANVRDNIRNRCDNDDVVSTGEGYDTQTGNLHGPVKQGINDLIAMDPDAAWSDACDCVVNSVHADWRQSERIGIIPVFHPGRVFKPGNKPIEFSTFIGLFFEGVQG
nr:hypothetical protein [Gemmatimonadota bacterium]